jgi:hypothetical protein
MNFEKYVDRRGDEMWVARLKPFTFEVHPESDGRYRVDAYASGVDKTIHFADNLADAGVWCYRHAITNLEARLQALEQEFDELGIGGEV